MRQRNQTGYALVVTPADGTDAFEVAAGDTVDYPDLITGCTPEPEPPTPAKSKTTRAADGGDTK